MSSPSTPDAFVNAATELARSLRQLDRQCVAFGASGHRYRFAPALSPAELQATEEALGVRLPDDYRAFLGRVGNGGAGPYYGVLPVRSEHCFTGLFPYKEAWKPNTSTMTDEEYDDYLADGRIGGSVLLSEVGCGAWTILIVAGSAVGEVWADYRENRLGLKPLATSFAAYWTTWAESLVAQFRRVGELLGAHVPHEEIHAMLDTEIGQLEVDKIVMSLLNYERPHRPRAASPSKPWGVACAHAQDAYADWLAGRGNSLP